MNDDYSDGFQFTNKFANKGVMEMNGKYNSRIKCPFWSSFAKCSAGIVGGSNSR